MRRRLILTLALTMTIAYAALIVTLATGTHPALGLDLQGGVSVTQQPKAGTSWSDESLDLAVDKIRERVDSLGVAEPEILRQGDTIVVNLPGVTNQEDAIRLVQVTGQVYLRPVIGCQAVSDPNAPVTPDSTDATGDTTGDSTGDSTADSTGDSAETTVPSTDAVDTTAAPGPARPVGSDTTTPGASPDTTTADTTADTTSGTDDTTTTEPAATSTTTPVPMDMWGYYPRQTSDPTQQAILPLRGEVPTYCQVGAAFGTGEVFTDAQATVGQTASDSGWGVSVDLRNNTERANWDNAVYQCFNKTSECSTGQLAIELDGELQSAPTINAPSFDSGVRISGSFTEQEAKDLARVLNSGSLPVTLEVLSVQNVSPTLGKDSLKAAWVSGLIGVFLVLLFMALYYRTLGLIVAIGLTVSGALLWSTISILSRTQGLALSLSGVAGIIVSVGVTVDSYVVFFERLKDEVRTGKSLRNSAQRGFQAAWRTIVVADLVSLIGAFVLWYLTVGAVRGFAFFLALSTACDLLVSYVFTRPMVLLLARTQWMERRKVMGIEVATSGGAA